jgi:hypothetical protein
MSTLKKAISKLLNTRDFENLNARVGNELGNAIKEVIRLANECDEECELLHKCITKLYEIDRAVPAIKKCLDKIEVLQNKNAQDGK